MMDSVSAANAAMSQRNAAAARPAVTCNKCGSRMVVWVTSKRTGKNYLANGLTCGIPGKLSPLAHRPHFKTCGTQLDPITLDENNMPAHNSWSPAPRDA